MQFRQRADQSVRVVRPVQSQVTAGFKPAKSGQLMSAFHPLWTLAIDLG